MFANRARTVLGAAGGALVIAVAAAGLHASGTPPPPRDNQTQGTQAPEKGTEDLYTKGYDLAKSEQYTEARKIFEDLAVQEPKNADVLNMLAYTQRKTGDLDQALGNYQKALKLKPKFPEARQYLGEAYLQLALREMDTLKGYKGSGDEQLRKLADSFQEAAAKAETDRPKGDGKGGW